jgi:hypothetical protein
MEKKKIRMKHLKRFKDIDLVNEELFGMFRKKSEEDKIVIEFINRLKKITGISPYIIEFSDAGTEQGESYKTRYSIFFDDIPIRISKLEADRKYKEGWNEETQNSWIKDGGIKKSNHVFYGIFAINIKEYITCSPKIAEELFNLIEKVYKQDKKYTKIKKIKDEFNPGADLIY